MSETADFFRVRLDQMIDLRHPLAVLANRMPWQEIKASISHRFAKQARAGKRLAMWTSLAAPCRSVVLAYPRRGGPGCRCA
jgi:hypothetical protein